MQKNTLKKILTLFLLATLLFQQAGVYYVLQSMIIFHQHKQWKLHFKNPGLLADLTLFDVKDITDLEWIKPRKEFVFQNDYYDVIRIESLNDSLRIVCFKDTREKSLMAMLSDTSDEKNNDPASQPIGKQLLKVLRDINLIGYATGTINSVFSDFITRLLPAIVFSSDGFPRDCFHPPHMFSILYQAKHPNLL